MTKDEIAIIKLVLKTVRPNSKRKITIKRRWSIGAEE